MKSIIVGIGLGMNPFTMFAPDTGTGYAPNWMNKYEIGVATADNETEPLELFELADGINEVTPSQEEANETFEYYGDKGASQTDITRATPTYAFTGHRKYADDEAQQLVRDCLNKTGKDRILFFKHTEPDGTITQGNATLTGIVHTGGPANSRGNFECSFTINGVPHEIPAEPTPGG
jgi:hypothetical protein